MEKCPCCNSQAIKETGEIKEKEELDYKNEYFLWIYDFEVPY